MSEHHPKDEFKYCPFCGEKDSFLFDGKKKFLCSKCGRTFYVNAAAATAAIIETPMGILFVRRKFEPQKNMLDLPGGFADLNERIEDSISRELCEELSLPKDTALTFFASFPNHYVYNNLLYTTLDIIFTARIENTSMLEASDDALSIEYIKYEYVRLEEIAFDSIRNALAMYIKKY